MYQNNLINPNVVTGLGGIGYFSQHVPRIPTIQVLPDQALGVCCSTRSPLNYALRWLLLALSHRNIDEFSFQREHASNTNGAFFPRHLVESFGERCAFGSFKALAIRSQKSANPLLCTNGSSLEVHFRNGRNHSTTCGRRCHQKLPEKITSFWIREAHAHHSQL